MRDRGESTPIDPMGDVTVLLGQVREGEPGAAEHMAALLYDQLKAMASLQMEHERGDHTLQPTALVHEAFVRLVGEGGVSFADRRHFLGAASQAIRRVLVDHARSRQRDKRGGGARRVPLDEAVPEPMTDGTLIQLDEALTELATFAPTGSRIVEARFFGGMTIPETAGWLGTSESTVEREWRVARAWLRERLEGDGGS